jgi:hypothetical protein
MELAQQLLKHAVECEETARFTRDLESKAMWRRMAERWRRCAEVFLRESSECQQRVNERRKASEHRKHAAAA